MHTFSHDILKLSAVAIVLVCLRPIGSDAEEQATWQAGAARVKITPAQPMWMAGYASRDKPATGTLTDLWAKALVLQDAQGHQGLLITLDLVGIDRDLSQSICQSLMEQYSLDRDQIVLCVSHTHTGPVVGRNLRPMHVALLDAEQQQRIRDYADWLQRKVLEVVAEAYRVKSDVRISAAHDRATFAVNRRNNPEGEVPARRAAQTLVGPVDHDVPVLAVRRQDDSLLAVVFGYACHATVLSSLEWSGDYPGFAQLKLESTWDNCVALFWAGCGADQNPLPRRKVELARDYGNQLAAAVQRAVSGTGREVAPRLETSYREIDLPLDTLPSVEQLEADTRDNNRYVASRARLLLQQIRDGQPLAKSYPYPLGEWRLGSDIRWLHLGGEVVVDYALKIKTLFPRDDVWVAGYSHDVMAYIPSRRVWHEGGYEGAGAMVYYGLPTRWAETVEDKILQAVHH